MPVCRNFWRGPLQKFNGMTYMDEQNGREEQGVQGRADRRADSLIIFCSLRLRPQVIFGMFYKAQICALWNVLINDNIFGRSWKSVFIFSVAVCQYSNHAPTCLL